MPPEGTCTAQQAGSSAWLPCQCVFTGPGWERGGARSSVNPLEPRRWVLCLVVFVCVFSLKNGYAPVEFFLEGTRSRTAKTLTPKFGRSLRDWGEVQTQRFGCGVPRAAQWDLTPFLQGIVFFVSVTVYTGLFMGLYGMYTFSTFPLTCSCFQAP